MSILFISDLHLSEDEPKTIEIFLKFLTDTAPNAEALYILGDFFEVWVGDDENTALHQKVSSALSKLAKKGVKVYFMHGNRDFLIGNTFAGRAHFTIIEDPTIIKPYGLDILLMHGDTLCIDDENYQKFRKKARNRFYQKVFLMLPLFLRRKIAASMRNASKKYTTSTDTAIMDVNTDEVLKVSQKYACKLIIHGHTHRPAIHKGNDIIRVVLSDWHGQGQYAELTPENEILIKRIS